MRVLVVALVVVSVGMFGRAFQLQAYDAQAYAAKAATQMTRTQELLPTRGEILDRNGEVLASSEPAVKVIADPSIIATNGVDPRVTLSASQRTVAEAAPGRIAAILAQYLGGSAGDYLPKLTATQPKSKAYSQYQVIKSQVPSWTYVQLTQALDAGGTVDGITVGTWYGIYKEDDPVRIHPQGPIASNVVGFTNSQGQGLAGLEYALNGSLKGTSGRETYETSAYGRIPLGNSTLTPAVNGTSYTLTIDAEMQAMAQSALTSQIRASGAEDGTAIVMNVKTGEVLAMASAPGFDPNNLNAADPSNTGNRAVTDTYEPGSVEKILTMATLADDGLVTPDTRVLVPSQIESGGGYIHDDFPHGTLQYTARGIVAESSNIGTVLLTRQVDKTSLIDHLKSFGLGSPTGIGLPGESSGSIPTATMPDYTRDQIAFGQGLSVTAIQMAAAVAGIVNGGVYNAPTIIKSAVDGNGNPVQIPRQAPRRVISKQASADVLDMMESVITQIGGGTRQIPNYRMAGKSGTAEIASDGAKNGYTASFVAVAPVEDPQILVYVVINHPTRQTQGSDVSLPVVRELMEQALPRYGVTPSTTPARHEPLTFQ